jgi:hypothetical protein
MGAEGGQVPYADGGETGSAFTPQSMFGQFLSNPAPQTPTFTPSSGAAALQKAIEGSGGTPKSPLTGKSTPMAGPDTSNVDPTLMMSAYGGNVGGKLKEGGHVPGKPKVSGNSYKNDTVKALLSPGEVVIPNSVMQSKDPIRGAASFVQSVLAKKGRK